MPDSDDPGVEQGGDADPRIPPAPSAGTCGGTTHVSINSRTRLAALGLVAIFAIGACSGGGTTAAPAGSQPAAESMAPESMAPIHGTGSVRGDHRWWPAGVPLVCRHLRARRPRVGRRPDLGSGGQALATELGSNTQFPAGLPIAITAPGEESGTFDSFVDVVLGDYLEAREQGDATTRLSNYQSSSDDNAIIDGIANSAGSFGWVGFAFYEENLDRVRAFTICRGPEWHVRRADGRDDRLERVPDLARPVHLRQQGRSSPRTRRSPPTSTTTLPTARSTASSRRCPTFP